MSFKGCPIFHFVDNHNLFTNSPAIRNIVYLPFATSVTNTTVNILAFESSEPGD